MTDGAGSPHALGADGTRPRVGAGRSLFAIFSLARVEFAIARRNRWAALATAIMVVLALALTLAGSAPRGSVGADALSVTVASLTSLAVYLVPLIALLVGYDAISGEAERGTLQLVLTYPTSRGELLAGKLLAQSGVVAVAGAAGYGAAAAGAWLVSGTASAQGLEAAARLAWTSALLGATFVSLAHALSCLARRSSGAAGLALLLWIVAVALYDLGLLAAVAADDGRQFTKEVFPWLLVLNPADAFRVYNLAASEAAGAASGLGGAAATVDAWKPLASILAWPFLAAALSRLAFSRVRP